MTPEEPSEPANAKVVYGEGYYSTTEVAKINGNCNCAHIAPTFPTFRNFHLKGCPFWQEEHGDPCDIDREVYVVDTGPPVTEASLAEAQAKIASLESIITALTKERESLGKEVANWKRCYEHDVEFPPFDTAYQQICRWLESLEGDKP